MEFTITPVEKEMKGAFVALTADKKLAGQMTFSKAGDSLFIIDHTEVEPSFEGQGVGKKLVQAAIAYIREKGVKVIPLCPFAKGYFDKHPEEVADILTNQK